MRLACNIAQESPGGRLRRPTEIPNLAAWYRADQGITIATGVSQWNDISGNARHLTQGTGGAQPLFVASAVNGKPAVRCDGADDFMTAAFALTQPCTMFFAVKNVAVGAAATHDVLVDGGTLGTVAIVQDNSPNFTITAGTARSSATTLANGVYDRWGLYLNGAPSYFTSAGATFLGPFTFGANNPGGLTLGALQNGSRSANVEFAEAIVYSRFLSASEGARVDAYLKARYAL